MFQFQLYLVFQSQNYPFQRGFHHPNLTFNNFLSYKIYFNIIRCKQEREFSDKSTAQVNRKEKTFNVLIPTMLVSL